MSDVHIDLTGEEGVSAAADFHGLSGILISMHGVQIEMTIDQAREVFDKLNEIFGSEEIAHDPA